MCCCSLQRRAAAQAKRESLAKELGTATGSLESERAQREATEAKIAALEQASITNKEQLAVFKAELTRYRKKLSRREVDPEEVCGYTSSRSCSYLMSFSSWTVKLL
jgi:septal ring factor EnvC (AmiA/AmiB activator)